MASASTLAPVTLASLQDDKLQNTQRRLAFLWDAAHSPLAMQAPAVAAHLIRSLRKLAAHEDCMLAASHTQTSFCSACCQVRLHGCNTRARVEASAQRKAHERKKRRRRQKRANERAQAVAAREETSDSGPTDRSSSKASSSELDFATPKKRRHDSASAATSAAGAFVSPFAGHAATPAAQSSNSQQASSASASASSAHVLVLTCLTCGHRDRIGGQSRKQKQLLRAVSADVDSLHVHTASGRDELEAQQAAQHQKAAAEAAARESSAKRQKLLHSLQSQQTHPVAAKASLRATQPSLELLSQAQQRLQAARVQLASGDAADSSVLQQMAPADDSFFSEQVRDAAAPLPSVAASASNAAAVPAAAPTPAASPAAPFTFSRVAAPAVGAGAKKPSLHDLLRGNTPAPAAFSSSMLTPQAAKGKPAAAGVSSGKKGAAGSAPAGAPSLLHGITIASGIQMPAAATPSFSFTKQTGKGAAQKKGGR